MINKNNNNFSLTDKWYNTKGGKNYKYSIELIHMNESYIKFELIDKNPKTNVYSVKNKNSDDLLGFIKWYSAWRQYCFFPVNSTVYSRGCMKDINDFINKIMEERKCIK